MRTVALVAQKGGSGKSTLAVHLAVCAARQGLAVALLDLDPQGSVLAWSERRQADDVAVLRATAAELPRLLARARDQQADLVVLDTAGRADETARQVVALADLVLVPCRPSLLDVHASLATVAMLGRARRAAFVLNAIPAHGTRHTEAREALAPRLPVAPVALGSYVAFADALNDGRSVEELDPSGRAASQVRELLDWMVRVCDGTPVEGSTVMPVDRSTGSSP